MGSVRDSSASYLDLTICSILFDLQASLYSDLCSQVQHTFNKLCYENTGKREPKLNMLITRSVFPSSEVSQQTISLQSYSIIRMEAIVTLQLLQITMK